MGLKELPTREFQRCVTTAFKTLGRGLQRSATNSPPAISVPAHVASPRQKMLRWRFAYFREPSLRFRHGDSFRLSLHRSLEVGNASLLDGNLPTSEQARSAGPPRCARISGWAHCSSDKTNGGSGSDGAAVACAANDRDRGRCAEAHCLRV